MGRKGKRRRGVVRGGGWGGRADRKGGGGEGGTKFKRGTLGDKAKTHHKAFRACEQRVVSVAVLAICHPLAFAIPLIIASTGPTELFGCFNSATP